jgi:TupA-like ATPgrasp
MPSLADKLAAYDNVKRRLCGDFIPSVVWAGDDIRHLQARDVSAGRYVLKANNGYTFVMFLSLPDELVSKSLEIVHRSLSWLRSRFGYDWGEWQYCTYKPRLFLERVVDFGDGSLPEDFKIFCFRGKAHVIEVDVPIG